MGSIGPMHLISLLIVVAVIAATCGYLGSVVAQRNMRRTRGIFLLGLGVGLVASAVLRGRRRVLNVLASVPRRADIRPVILRRGNT